MSDDPVSGAVIMEASESGTLLRCTAPASATLRIDFYDAAGHCTGSEDVQPGETRVIAARGAFYVPVLTPEGHPAPQLGESRIARSGEGWG